MIVTMENKLDAMLSKEYEAIADDDNDDSSKKITSWDNEGGSFGRWGSGLLVVS